MSTFSQLPQYLKLPEDPEQSQRLFHGRGHAYQGLEHITMDWLSPVVLINLYAPEPDAEIESFADYLLAKIATCQSVQLQRRYRPLGPIELIRGTAINKFIIKENDFHFAINLGAKQNIGLFLDMKNGRQWLQAQSKDKRVLNLFAYTCGFSVAAIAGGARSVVNVDMSSAALNVGRENHRLNQQALENVSFEKLNIFKSFGRLKRCGPFDLLVCDPPTLQKGSIDIVRDYPKIIRRLDDFMTPASTLILCLNSPKLGRDFLIDMIATWAPNYYLIGQIKPPAVFIDAEDKGLKVLCFKR